MKKSIFWIALLLFVFGLYWKFDHLRNLPAVEQSKSKSVAQPNRPGASDVAPGNLTKGSTSAIVRGGEGVGWPTAEAYLSAAISKGDRVGIFRAVHELYWSQIWKRDDVIVLLKSYLSSADPFLRVEVAKALLTIGDKSGVPVLMAMAAEQNPTEGIAGDLRIEAAKTLASYRDREVLPVLENLYESTHDTTLLSSFGKLGVAPQGQALWPYVSSYTAIEHYVEENTTRFLPQITGTFRTSSDPNVKSAAAWALVSMTGDSSALSYLSQLGQNILSQGNGSTVAGSPPLEQPAKVFQYLGEIQGSESKTVLESALSSDNQDIKETALVNLVLNQSRSDKAISFIVNQLSETSPPSSWVSWELMLNLAAQDTGDPEIAAAGQIFSTKSRDGSWDLYVNVRKDWPIYNWIDNYTVKTTR